MEHSADEAQTLEDLSRLMKSYLESRIQQLSAASAQDTAAADDARHTSYDEIAIAFMEQLEQTSMPRLPGKKAYAAFNKCRDELHTPEHWDDSQWLPKWQEVYKSRACEGALTPFQTIVLSVVTDDTISAAEMRNLLAVLALLPSDKVLPFYNFLMYEKMNQEAKDALEHMDTIPVPMHNPRLLSGLNTKTLQEFENWKAGETVHEVYDAPQQPFSLYAEDDVLKGLYREGGVFGRTPWAQHTKGMNLLAAGALDDVPLIKLPLDEEGACCSRNRK